MTGYSNNVIAPFDFSIALTLDVEERVDRSIHAARKHVAASGYQAVTEFQCVPTSGATACELDILESELGIVLPAEYRLFLSKCRYLKLGDECEVGGVPRKGVFSTEPLWVSHQHETSTELLVFAKFSEFADGDQLLIDLSDSSYSVVAYLHEHGPAIEFYAPSFSLALWRLVHQSNG